MAQDKGRRNWRPFGAIVGRGRGSRMTWIEDWAGVAACQQSRPDELFVRGAEQHRAKLVCTTCPVRTECLAEALDNRIEWGVWGGMTERERRAVLRRRPNVKSWRRLLETAEAEHSRRTDLLPPDETDDVAV